VTAIASASAPAPTGRLETVADLAGARARRESELSGQLEVRVRVARKAVECDHGVEPEHLRERNVPTEVRAAAEERLSAAVGIAAVMLECAHRRDECHRAGRDPSAAADEVDELLELEVGVSRSARGAYEPSRSCGQCPVREGISA
jgi:hypothetical protein